MVITGLRKHANINNKIMQASYNRLGALWASLARHTKLCSYVDERDHSCFQDRLNGEGLPFLTHTLPALGKDLELAFATRQFKLSARFKCAKGTAYPLFLSKAFASVFDRDGTLREGVDAGAVTCIRQLTLIFYKLRLGFTPDQEEKTGSQFIKTDSELPPLDPPRLYDESDPHDYGTMLDAARAAVHGLLKGCYPYNISPCHGSGASACGVKPTERYGSPRYIKRLDDVFNYGDHFFLNQNHIEAEGLRWWMTREEVEPPARVVYVEKDSRGPRLISCEPREFMFIQQGLMAKLYAHVKRNESVRMQLDFEDQSRNRDAAQAASLTGSQVTLDLSEASDRVSWDLVKYLFPSDWVRAFGACRSLHTLLPDGRRLAFKKFAPMGSALCFPVEAICFWALTIAAIPDGGAFLRRTLRDEVTYEDYVLRVFGDDIVCDAEIASDVIRNLHSVGLKVNTTKSYTAGPFRESCGGDFLNGKPVNIVRARYLPIVTGDKRTDRPARHRTVDLMNNLINRYGAGAFGDSLYRLLVEWYGPITRDANWVLTTPNGEIHYAHEPSAWLYIELGIAEFVRPHGGLTLLSMKTKVPRNVRKKIENDPNPRNSNYGRTVYRLETERAVERKLDGHGWCPLLRCFLVKHKERSSLVYALARRVKYTHAWVELSC